MFLQYFCISGPPTAVAGTLGDPEHHFVEIFRYLGQHFASEGLPKGARRPPERARHCVLVDFGVPAEAPNPYSACKKMFQFARVF